MLLALLSLSACTCRTTDLQPVPSSIRVQPSQVDFGLVVVGQVATRTVELVNDGKVALDGTWSLEGAAFSTDDARPTRAGVGSTVVELRCAPPNAGVFDGVLSIALEGFEPIRVPLSCEGAPVPACVASGPCVESQWDVTLGRCVETPKADGASCEGSDACLLQAACRAGRCEGTPRDCDDGDPCTQDSCHPARGCEHRADVACPGDGPCRVGRCAAGSGCVLEDAEDGTPCGPLRTCTLADVCIGGACVQRRPPDGFVCSPASPCSSRGVCVGESCEPVARTTLDAGWSLAVPLPDGGAPGPYSDLLVDDDGTITLSSYFESLPLVGANSTNRFQLPQTARRCIHWFDRLVCGDFPALPSAPVTALASGTGQQLWTFTGALARIPEFAGPTVQFFTARLSVMSESELAVLYESRTLSDMGVDPRCRTFALVVLDRQGQPLRSTFINDPIFTVCDHPHSYGVATDAQSNLYLAFTPSGGDNPATTLTGTTIFSYSPALQLRWRRFVTGLRGGELSVADGLLFQERSAEVRSTQTGDVVATLSEPFGLGVIGRGVAISQGEGTGTLRALDTTTLQPRWARPVTGRLGRSPLSVGTWVSPWGPRDVALSFSDANGSVFLEATELATGANAFSCPIALPELPTQASVTPGGGVAVMSQTQAAVSGGPLCDDCDPKYARTTSNFWWFWLPDLIEPPVTWWPGAWGGPAHSHHEGH